MNIINASNQGIYDESSTPLWALGTLYAPEGFGGRLYRYTRNGATALAAGKLVQSTAPDSNVVNVTAAATEPIGEVDILLDAGGAITANTYDDGFLVVNDATGEGYAYRVVSHTAVAAAGELTATIAKPGLRVALTVDVSEVSLYKNPWNGVVVTPTTNCTGLVVGVPNIAVTANYYFWAQVKGPCAVLTAGTPAVGGSVIYDSTVAGSCEVIATGTITEPIIGRMMDVGVDTEYKPVYLCIE